jgi:hypothetical protein
MSFGGNTASAVWALPVALAQTSHVAGLMGEQDSDSFIRDVGRGRARSACKDFCSFTALSMRDG